MNTYIIKEETLTDIADAIREREESSNSIMVSDYATRIENLPSGADISEYFNDTIQGGQDYGWKKTVKKIPAMQNIGTSCDSLYSQCSASEIDVSLIDTTNITTFRNMFAQSRNVISLDLSHFNTTSVSTMENMFSECNNLSNVDLSSFDISRVTTVFGMFRECNALTVLDLSNFKNSNVNDCRVMFYNCTNLVSIDLSNFNHRGYGISSNSMFDGCVSLQHLDIRKLDLTQMQSSYMFNNVPNNCEIIVKDSANKTWLNNNWPNLTNVKIVAEL